MQNLNEKPVGIGDRINEFIQKHRKPIFITAVAVFLVLIICIVFISLLDVFREKAIVTVENLNSRYEVLRPEITGEESESDPENDALIAQLLEELESFANKSLFGYARGRAWLIVGVMYSDMKDWEQAEKAWLAAAKAAGKTHLVPVAYFNAGAAAEEQGKPEDAISCYAKCLSADFPASTRAQFAIGRLWESLNDDTAALEAYRSVISGWPHDSVWVNLAHSRIIALEAK